MKNIDNLIEDIYSLYSEDQDITRSKDALAKAARKMGKNIADLVLSSFEERRTERKRNLRLSTIGKPKRHLWYQLKNYEGDNSLKPNDYIKFLYGHILEELLLFLTYASGHSVTEQQKKVKIGGITGHKDCRIDGVTVDIKSASHYAFKKFKEGTLEDDDPFGYISQLSAYIKAEGDNEGAFLVIDKQNGELTLLKLHQMELDDVEGTIKSIKNSLDKDHPPDRCYEDVPFGKSGNRHLAIGCKFCEFKHHCWSDANNGQGLRVFDYSSGPVYFTHIVNEPKVSEWR